MNEDAAPLAGSFRACAACACAWMCLFACALGVLYGCTKRACNDRISMVSSNRPPISAKPSTSHPDPHSASRSSRSPPTSARRCSAPSPPR
jgi:hypothetical protein